MGHHGHEGGRGAGLSVTGACGATHVLEMVVRGGRLMLLNAFALAHTRQVRGHLSLSKLDRSIVPTRGLDDLVMGERLAVTLRALVAFERGRRVLTSQWGFDEDTHEVRPRVLLAVHASQPRRAPTTVHVLILVLPYHWCGRRRWGTWRSSGAPAVWARPWRVRRWGTRRGVR